MGRAYSTNGREEVIGYLLVGKPDGKTPLGRPRRRWVDNIKMDLREVEWCGMDWTDLAEDRDQWTALVNRVMNSHVPYNVRKFLSSCTTGDSRKAQLRGVRKLVIYEYIATNLE
jgi:hypothetical protein